MTSSVIGSGLTVVLDIRDPFSYLALRPAFDFLDEMGIDATWLPIRGHSLVAPSTPSRGDDRGTRHRRFRAEMIAREIAVYANVQGLVIRSPYRQGPADAAHIAWLWIRECAADRLRVFLEEAFRRYWALELDPDNPDDLATLLEDLSFEIMAFRRWAAEHGKEAIRSLGSELADAQVYQGPAYVWNGEVFYGRQHLPMIRWLLEGASGDRPI